MPFQTLINILSTSIAATASLVLSPLCCRAAPLLGAMDVPKDKRRMHSHPIPRAGGIALFPAIFVSLAVLRSQLFIPLLIGGAIIFAAGFSDDILRLSPTVKLSAQAPASAVTLTVGGSLFLPEGASLATYIFSFIWMLLVTNAFNLIDGLDGLCAGIGISSSLSVFAIGGAVEALTVTAALIGFLPMNRHPAKMFLGDSGAMLIGFLISALTLPLIFTETPLRGFISAAMLLAFPLFDTLSAFLRRVARGHSPFHPDRKHLHHLLIDGGLSHLSASRFLVTLSVASGCIGTLTARLGLSPVTVICFGLFLSAIGCTLLFYLSSTEQNKTKDPITRHGG